jgi:hypothetical protein
MKFFYSKEMRLQQMSLWGKIEDIFTSEHENLCIVLPIIQRILRAGRKQCLRMRQKVVCLMESDFSRTVTVTLPGE